MGGSYLWQWDGEVTESTSGSKIPVYSKPRYLGEFQLFPIFKQDGTPRNDYFLGKSGTFIQVIHRIDELKFEIDEERSNIFGEGLFETDFKTVNVTKILAQDFNGNGLIDLIIGENDWSEYHPQEDGVSISWGDERYKPFDEKGNYRGGPAHGKVHIYRNVGLFDEDDEPINASEDGEELINMVFGPESDEFVETEPYFKFEKVGTIEGVDVYGNSTPAFADYRKDGSLDLVTGNFVRDITYFKQILAPDAASTGDKLQTMLKYGKGKKIIEMLGVINYTEAWDLNNNGRMDIIIGSENGHVYFAENPGMLDGEGYPLFLEPLPLLQSDAPLKSDILPVPSIGELRKGHIDMIAGNGAGLFDHFTDLDFQNKTASFKGLISEIPRILPPIPQGSIQGPTEIGWGYICSKLFDWNGNGLLDIVFSDVNGEHQVAENIGDAGCPKFKAPVYIINQDTQLPLTTVWRVKPAIINLKRWIQKNGSSTNTKEFAEDTLKYICEDDKGYLCIYTKTGSFELGKKQFLRVNEEAKIKLTKKFGGSLGRVKLTFMDWNGNGLPDILMGVPGSHEFLSIPGNEDVGRFSNSNLAIMLNATAKLEADKWAFHAPRYLHHKEKQKPVFMGNHTCAPEPYHHEGETYLIVGTEDGQFYQFNKNEFEIK